MPSKSSKDDASEGLFSPGDNVEVCEGELINLQGKVVSVEGNKVVMLPFHDDLKVRYILRVTARLPVAFRRVDQS